jgi:hypothetical protein
MPIETYKCLIFPRFVTDLNSWPSNSNYTLHCHWSASKQQQAISGKRANVWGRSIARWPGGEGIRHTRWRNLAPVCSASISEEISFLKEIWTSWRKLLGNSNLKEIWRKFRKIEGNVKEIALFLQNPKNTAISKEMRFKICWKSCLQMQNLKIFWVRTPRPPMLILLRVNLGKLFVSPLW